MTLFLALGTAIALFSALLALTKRSNQMSDKIFAAFLLSIALPMVNFLVLQQPFFTFVERYQPILFGRTGDFMPLTLGPFMALYVESLTVSNFKLTKKRLYHFLPFAVFMIIASSFPDYTIFYFHTQAADRVNPLEAVYIITLMTSFVAYTVWVQTMLQRHRKRVLDHFAQNPNQISLIWLSWTAYLFFIVFAVAHIPKWLRVFGLFPDAHRYDFAIDTGFHLCFVLFICVVSFFGVRQTQVFSESVVVRDEEEMLVDQEQEVEEQGEGKKQPPLSQRDDLLEEQLVRLENFVATERPYLDSDLTLATLAEMVGIPPHQLTQVLNRKLQKNFHNYINDYRIEAIKPLLCDPEYASKSIITLAYEVGFNSKSTFNAIFKRSTLLTPTQFRKQCTSTSKT